MKNYGKELTPVTYSPAAITGKTYVREEDYLCFRLHWHDRMEILRIRKGSLLVTFDGNEATIRAGEVFIIPPRAIHSGIAGADGVEYDVLMFDIQNFYNPTDVCRALLPALFDGRAKLRPCSDAAELVAVVDALSARLGEASLLITAEVYRLLHLLMTHCLIEISSEVRTDTVRSIIRYLEQNYTEELDIERVCAEFGYSAAHLCRKFRESTGLTPMRYLRIYRLEEAKKQLRNSEGSVSEIAAQCGFADANYFTRCFRKHFGAAPTSIRK